MEDLQTLLWLKWGQAWHQRESLCLQCPMTGHHPCKATLCSPDAPERSLRGVVLGFCCVWDLGFMVVCGFGDLLGDIVIPTSISQVSWDLML